MKKSVITLAVVCGAAALLCGCESCCGKEPNEYEKLNKMLSANYSQIDLTVTDKIDDKLSLTSTYVIIYTDSAVNVSYSVERLAELSLDAPVQDFKTTFTGEAVINGGKVTILSGQSVDISADIEGTGLVFKEEYFENVEMSGIYFIADVANPSGFLGANVECTQMKVSAEFIEAFNQIKINYRLKSGSSVEYRYTFHLKADK